MCARDVAMFAMFPGFCQCFAHSRLLAQTPCHKYVLVVGRLGQVASEDQDPGDLVALDLVLACWISPWQDLRHGREY